MSQSTSFLTFPFWFSPTSHGVGKWTSGCAALLPAGLSHRTVPGLCSSLVPCSLPSVQQPQQCKPLQGKHWKLQQLLLSHPAAAAGVHGLVTHLAAHLCTQAPGLLGLLLTPRWNKDNAPSSVFSQVLSSFLLLSHKNDCSPDTALSLSTLQGKRDGRNCYYFTIILQYSKHVQGERLSNDKSTDAAACTSHPFFSLSSHSPLLWLRKKKSHLNIYVLETSHLPRNESWFALHNAECNLIPPTGEVCCIAQTPVWWTSHLSRWHVHTMCTCKPHLSSQEEIHSIKT